MKQDNTPRDYTQLMSEGMWEKAGDDIALWRNDYG